MMAAVLAATTVSAHAAELLPDAAGIFGRIAESGQRHTDAVLTLLDKYRPADPAARLAPGEFADPGLQGLYATLIDVDATGFPEAGQKS